MKRTPPTITCAGSARRGTEPHLWAGRAGGEREPYEVAVLLPGVLNPVERWFQEFRRRALSNKTFETVELVQQEALTEALAPYYWRVPARLRSLTGFSWWVEAIESLGHQSP